MNKYEEKAEKIEQHLKRHPRDYQGVVSFFTARSDAVACERRQAYNRMQAEIAKYK